MNTPGYVYAVLNSTMEGWVKVGMTTRPNAQLRADDYGCQLPGETTAAYSRATEDPRQIEKRAHELLIARFIKKDGEWFRCSLDHARYAIDEAMGSPGPQPTTRTPPPGYRTISIAARCIPASSAFDNVRHGAAEKHPGYAWRETP